MQGRDTERVKRDTNQYVPCGNGRADIAGCHQGRSMLAEKKTDQRSAHTKQKKTNKKTTNIKVILSPLCSVHEYYVLAILGNVGILANFVFLFFCSFHLSLHQLMLVNVKLELKGYMKITF